MTDSAAEAEQAAERPVRALCRRCGGEGMCIMWRFQAIGAIGADGSGVLEGADGASPEKCTYCCGQGWLPIGG